MLQAAFSARQTGERRAETRNCSSHAFSRDDLTRGGAIFPVGQASKFSKSARKALPRWLAAFFSFFHNVISAIRFLIAYDQLLYTLPIFAYHAEKSGDKNATQSSSTRHVRNQVYFLLVLTVTLGRRIKKIKNLKNF
jgi:hypothetical protein